MSLTLVRVMSVRLLFFELMPNSTLFSVCRDTEPIGAFCLPIGVGAPIAFVFAVNFPGGPRHDLGLYDMVALLVLTAVLNVAARFRPRQGRLMGILAMGYSVSRFFLDVLRASDMSFVDRRYLGLTPAQYIVVGLFAVGVWLVTRPAPEVQRSEIVVPPEPAPEPTRT